MNRIMMPAGAACHNEYRAPSFAARLAALLAAVVDAPDTWIERMQQRRELAELDERMLDDIGLDRVAVDREIHKSFWQR